MTGAFSKLEENRGPETPAGAAAGVVALRAAVLSAFLGPSVIQKSRALVMIGSLLPARFLFVSVIFITAWSRN